MAPSGIIEILFFGDLVGQPGRTAVTAYLAGLKKAGKTPDVVIANVENASHGFGLNRKHYEQLQTAGINIFTSGNHIWDRKEIFDYVKDADNLLRPHNFPSYSPGEGVRIIDVNGFRVGVINLIGQVFMGNYNSPWESLDAVLPEVFHETPVIFVDFHAETTAEKICFANYAASQGVSAMVGTHTHVQTADERILSERMGYITDAGFNGAYDSVIGMEWAASLERLKYHRPARLEVADSDQYQVNGVRFWVETRTGICQRVERVNELLERTEIVEFEAADTASQSSQSGF